MPAEPVKAEITNAYKRIKKNLPNFCDRPQQRQMIALVSKTLGGEQKPIIAIEGPTGTGKTLAYLIGSIPIAKHLNKRLVISSHTIALQEQLLTKDIPLVRKHTDYQFKAALAKGRGRYVCISKLSRLCGEPNVEQSNLLASMELELWSEKPSQDDVSLIKTIFTELKDGEWNGDFDHCNHNIPYQLKSKIRNDFHTCTSNKCSDYDRCTFFQKRKSLGGADVIIANHDLVLADMSNKNQSVLPPIEESLYIFDEAHHLPIKAIDHFSSRSDILGALKWIKSIPKAFEMQIEGVNLSNSKEEIQSLSQDLANALQELHQALKDQPLKKSHANDEIYRFPFGKPPEVIMHFGENRIWPVLKRLHNKVVIANEMLKKNAQKEDVNIKEKEQQMSALGFLSGRLESLYKLWYDMLKTDEPNTAPFVRWMDTTDDDYALHVAPICADNQLQKTIWGKTTGCVLTSATLTSLNSYDRLKSISGLTEEKCEFIRLSSPFDPSKVMLSIPNMAHTPKNPDGHTREIIKHMPDLLDEYLGTLVLFSSRVQKDEVYQSLSIKYKSRVLDQDRHALEYILSVHRERIKNSKHSAIFGVSSFAEGLDLPRNLCKHVVIAKLPFAVPTSPRASAYAEWVESLGQSSFFSISLPDACMSLKQSCGRLIRTEDDSGKISILDTRLLKSGYGKQILESLPNYARH